MSTQNPADSASVLSGEAMALTAATYLHEKKGENVVILDVRGISPVTDYYLVCTATSVPHLRALAKDIKDRFWVEHSMHPIAKDENFESLWAIQHFGDVMVHLFHKDLRDYYNLEELWGDAEKVAWTPPVPPALVDAVQSAKELAQKLTQFSADEAENETES